MRFDIFGLDAGTGEQFLDLLGVLRKIDKFPQPINGKLHYANCRKKRKSFCANKRMSGMSNKIMASRSMPRPNAKPVHFSGSYALSPGAVLTAWKAAGFTLAEPAA